MLFRSDCPSATPRKNTNTTLTRESPRRKVPNFFPLDRSALLLLVAAGVSPRIRRPLLLSPATDRIPPAGGPSPARSTYPPDGGQRRRRRRRQQDPQRQAGEHPRPTPAPFLPAAGVAAGFFFIFLMLSSVHAFGLGGSPVAIRCVLRSGRLAPRDPISSPFLSSSVRNNNKSNAFSWALRRFIHFAV